MLIVSGPMRVGNVTEGCLLLLAPLPHLRGMHFYVDMVDLDRFSHDHPGRNPQVIRALIISSKTHLLFST